MTAPNETMACAQYRAADGAGPAAPGSPERCAGCVFFSSRNCRKHNAARAGYLTDI